MELLVPAGNWEAFLAGINNGADAVYIGGKSFSARQYASNFSDEEIKKALEYAHIRERKIYVTVNTLIDQEEFKLALDYIYKLYNLGIDAVIVQDLGLVDAIRQIMPSLRIHASTQMTIHNALGAEFLQNEGIKRIVLAREMSLDDLNLLRASVSDVELEVFIHGALCYSYSGQCLFSSLVGGRSGNRGRCAGPCRLPYDLYKSSSKLNLKPKGNYLLSPADLCSIHLLKDLKAIGIDSLKIEGRMKRAEYVAIVTNTYRKALDELDHNSRNIEKQYNNLIRVFNRNFSTGYLVKGNEADFLSTLRPDNRGVYLGKVVSQDSHFNTNIILDDQLNIGDGIEIEGGKDNIALIVSAMKISNRSVDKANKGDLVTLKLNEKVFKNDKVYKNYDKALFDKALKTVTEDDYKIDVDISLILEKGEYAKLIIEDDMGNYAEEMGAIKAEVAQNRPLDEDIARSKMARLGDTPFRLRNFYFSNVDNVLVPFSDLNDTRRRAGNSLLEKRLQKTRPSHKSLSVQDFSASKNVYLKLPSDIQNKTTKLSVFVSSIEDAKLAVNAGAEIVYVGLEGISTHKKINPHELLEVSKWAEKKGANIVASLPKIQKPTDPNVANDLLDLGYKNFLVGNLGALYWCKRNNLDMIADYTFNFFNPYALRYIIEKNVKRVCLSPELNLKQIAKFPDLSKAELIVHGDLAVMTSEYCMLSGVLSKGEKPCRERICRRDNYYIQDDKGFSFPIVTDANCRFYVLNSRTLCMIEDLYKLIKLKPYALRIEAHRLRGEELTKTITIYRQALDQINNNLKPELLEYKKQLGNISSSSFTKGHYYRGVL